MNELGFDPSGSTARSTRDVIIQAAWECFRQFGPRKTTIADISRAANLSRGTVYLYFKDKSAILQATAENASKSFYAALADSMRGLVSLEEQFASAAVFVCRSKQQLRHWEKLFDAEAVAVLLTSDGVLLRECVEFLSPYIESATATGEVRADLDVGSAAEWFARILFSLYSTPSPLLDLDDPATVKRFVESHVIAGFAPRRQTLSRANR